MRFVNGWNYMFKETDRFNFELRISSVTLFRLFLDLSGHKYDLTILNFRVEFGQ